MTAVVFALSQDISVPWIGEKLLESHSASKAGIDIVAFVEEWRELLPESWRAMAKLDLLSVGQFQCTHRTLLIRSRASMLKPQILPSYSVKTFKTNNRISQHRQSQEGKVHDDGMRSSKLEESKLIGRTVNLKPSIFLICHPLQPARWFRSIIMPFQTCDAIFVPMSRLTGRLDHFRCR